MTAYVEKPGPVRSAAPSGDHFHDCDVIDRASLDAKHAATFKSPWLVQFHTGYIVGFETEAEACREQRIYRARNSRHPDTGEAL